MKELTINGVDKEVDEQNEIQGKKTKRKVQE